LALAHALAVVAPATPAAEAATAAKTNAVEDHYTSAGPWVVVTTEVAAADGLTYRIAHPRDLGRGAFKHPILIWGNGSNATPDLYTGVFRQLASWGFVVIGSSDRQQGDGRTMLAALQYLVAANLDPASKFFGVLDPTEVGALGHSQGAGGAVNAANHSGGLVDTAVPINLPDSRYVQGKGAFSVADLPTPTLFLGGSTDGLFSTTSGLCSYYQHAPRAALGILRGADHLAIQRSGNGYLGYLTAWMMWNLQHDAYAGSAFVGKVRKNTEFRRNPKWQGQLEKGLS
jgi:hypothetical protein